MESKEKNKALNELLIQTIICIIFGVFFGYCGFTYSQENNYDVVRATVYSALFPFIFALIKYLYDF